VRFTDTTSNLTNALALSPTFGAVTYAQGLFVAVGGQGPYSGRCPLIWTSPDGTAWTDRSLPSCGGSEAWTLSDVIYTPEKQAFVAMGPGAVFVSTAGIVWSLLQPGNPPLANTIAFGNGHFLAAVGEYVFTSADALNWSQVAYLQGYILNAVAFFDGAFWAGGRTDIKGNSVGTILRSSDAKIWYPVDGLNLPQFSQFWGLSVAGDSLLALGERGLILQSASVVSPPQFRAWETRVQNNGAVALALDAAPGSILSIDFSGDLKAWSLLQVVTNTATRVQIDDPGARGVKRFYRASAN
jgi:hypothetical protein